MPPLFYILRKTATADAELNGRDAVCTDYLKSKT
jgi:hypothetical protein